jgi:hypothetical protein
MKLPEGVERFFYGTPQLTASAAAVVGLGLYFGGVVDKGWWAIVAGLYAGTYLVTRALSPDSVALDIDEARLQLSLRELVGSARARVSPEAGIVLDHIVERAESLIPVLDDLTGRGVIGAKVRHDVLTGLTRYLPDTLSSYLALPPAYLKRHQHRVDGPGAQLLAQLKLIDAHLARCLDEAFGEHAEALAVQGRFLAERMGRSELP